MVAKTGIWAGKKWKFAPALLHLVEQLDRACPDRATKSDGSIASHRHYENNPHSDHDPHYFRKRGNLVTAVDITHNADKGINCAYLFDSLLKSQDGRIKYVIFNRQIFNDPRFVSHTGGAKRRGAWNPGHYDGADPHTGHIHISVWGENADDTADWALPDWLTTAERQAHLHRLAQAKDIVDKQDPNAENQMRGIDYTNKITTIADGIKAGEITPLDDWLKKTEESLQAAGADPHSLTYTMRFYRQLAGRAGFDGARPEDVADWVYSHIQSLQLAVGELKGDK